MACQWAAKVARVVVVVDLTSSFGEQMKLPVVVVVVVLVVATEQSETVVVVVVDLIDDDGATEIGQLQQRQQLVVGEKTNWRLDEDGDDYDDDKLGSFDDAQEKLAEEYYCLA